MSLSFHVECVVSIDFTGLAGLHLSCLLDLKYQNAFTGTCRGIEKESENEVGLSGQDRLNS